MPVTLSKLSAGRRETEREGCLTGRSWVGSLREPMCHLVGEKKKCPQAAR